ncbi:MAG: mono/diheme cytochrome c family protein [Saprospiraceae bacterium]|jgi:mono/diheme cytochrome c family protein
MKNYIKFSIFFTALCVIFFTQACKDDEMVDPIGTPPQVNSLLPPDGTSEVPASSQALGDAEAGRNYLFTGDFEESGIPYDLFSQFSDGDGNLLEREGDNASLPYNFNAVNAPNGVKIAAPNCFTCHAQELNGELIIGLGNSLSDYTVDQTANVNNANAAIAFTYGADSPEYDAYQPLRIATLATASQLVVPFIGPNPASKLTAVLAAHRDPATLAWLEEAAFPINDNNLPSDVPAWWHLKKKNAMFLDASARGDFRKYTMASSLLTISDVDKAEEVYENFDDVLAYLYSIEAPGYPGPEAPHRPLFEFGEELFFDNCAKCHGTYGVDDVYPNLFVKTSTVQTEPFYTLRNEAETDFLQWWDESWFGISHETANFEFGQGYYAPPLDGIWATAPYLHNGSVPDLATFLDSSIRPKYWKRNFDNPQYNEDNTGWEYEEMLEGGDPDVYDTTQEGYDNRGHYFADEFTENERRSLLEYLKTI